MVDQHRRRGRGGAARRCPAAGAVPRGGCGVGAALRRHRRHRGAPAMAAAQRGPGGADAAGGGRWPGRNSRQRLEDAFRRQGYTVERGSGAVVDFELERQGRRTLVCAKRWKSARLGLEPLRALQAERAAADASEALFIGLGELTDTARPYAAAARHHGLAGGRPDAGAARPRAAPTGLSKGLRFARDYHPCARHPATAARTAAAAAPQEEATHEFDVQLARSASRSRRRRRARRAPALAADRRHGRAARDRHVRRHRAGAHPDGLRPQPGHPDERHRHAHLLPDGGRQGAQLPGVELRLHRRGHRGHRLRRPGRQRQPRRGAGRHRRLRRALHAHRPRRDGHRHRLDRAPHAAGGDRRRGRRDRPEPGRHPDQEHGAHRLRRLDAGRHLRLRGAAWRCSRAA